MISCSSQLNETFIHWAVILCDIRGSFQTSCNAVRLDLEWRSANQVAGCWRVSVQKSNFRFNSYPTIFFMVLTFSRASLSKTLWDPLSFLFSLLKSLRTIWVNIHSFICIFVANKDTRSITNGPMKTLTGIQNCAAGDVLEIQVN